MKMHEMHVILNKSVYFVCEDPATIANYINNWGLERQKDFYVGAIMKTDGPVFCVPAKRLSSHGWVSGHEIEKTFKWTNMFCCYLARWTEGKVHIDKCIGMDPNEVYTGNKAGKISEDGTRLIGRPSYWTKYIYDEEWLLWLWVNLLRFTHIFKGKKKGGKNIASLCHWKKE